MRQLLPHQAEQASPTVAPPLGQRQHSSLLGQQQRAQPPTTGGRPLEPHVRHEMQAHFGHDFSQVRVHSDAQAARSAEALGALGYAYGRHIVLRRDQDAPHTPAGRRLLAHELAHVVQQSRGEARPDVPAAALEQDAERQARRAAAEPQERPAARPLRPLAAPARPLLQRYEVPGTLRCDELVDWLNGSSPYAPEWAETRCTYSYKGGLKVSYNTLPDGTVEARVKGHSKLKVEVDCPIDRPEWSPDERPNRAAELKAWKAMLKVLNAHEQEHRTIGKEWRKKLEDRVQAVDLTVGGADQAEALARAVEAVEEQKQAWKDEAQQAQDAIDPFRGAILACPEEESP